jgi:uncharacterized protein (TIGR00730 family)
LKRICVFCGGNVGRDPRYREAAEELGRQLVRRGLGLVFGGGSVGLMGAVADATLAAGGHVIGVIPHGLAVREVAHRGLTELRVVSSMHERKAMMARLADAFVALPGGFGTFEELFEIVTWAQLGIHRKPIGLLNVAGYYDGLIRLLDHAVAEGFVPAENRGLIVVAEEPAPLLERLAGHQGPIVREWIGPDEA